jgi:hypothetical protein
MTLYRKILSIDGVPFKMGGHTLGVPPWRSADNDGGANPQAWFASRITNGYFNGYDPKRVGQKASETNLGSGRATTYFDTGHADVAIEGIYENNIGLSALPCVRVTPDYWEHNIAAFPEVWLSPELGIGPWVIWYIAAPSRKQTIPCYGPGQLLAPGTPRLVRLEVVGRRVKAFDENNVLKMEFIVPPHMEHSTKHGVTHDVTMQYRPDGAGGWVEMPNFGETEGMLESSWSFTPITHFSDELPGVIGPEKVRNINFTTASDWTTDGGWTIDTTTDDDLLIRPSAVVEYAESGAPFSSGYFRQELTEPLITGRTYRLTFNVFPMELYATEIPAVTPILIGFGGVSARVYDAGSSTALIPDSLGGSQYRTGATTVEFVATGPHTHIELTATAMEDLGDLGTYKLQRKVNYVSLREVTR